MTNNEYDKFEGLCERDRINASRFSKWYIAFNLLFLISIVILGPVKGGIMKIPLWHWALALVPVVPAFLTLNAYFRFIKVADELIKHVHFEAATRSFILMIFLGYLYYLATQLFGPWEDSGPTLWFIGLATYMISMRRAWRRLNV